MKIIKKRHQTAISVVSLFATGAKVVLRLTKCF